jgi:membrane-bound lytic murein transglycosylase D
MKRANRAQSRAIGLAILGALASLSGAGSARAQSVDSGFSRALDPSYPLTAAGLDHDLERAESLFRQGEAALTDGREIEAREAFDAALDVFVEMRGPAGSDPRFLAAYRNLVDRIHAAEVAAGPERGTAPVPVPSLRIEGEVQVESPGETPPQSTLAELGDRVENIKPTEEARQTTEEVIGSEEIDLPIELNDQVLGAIDLYTGKFNKWFSRALSRGLPYLPRIREILAEAGVPQDLAYVPIVESAFNPSALSRAKARGLWQFIPSTGKQYGLRQDFFVDERSNMEKATLAAAQYLKKLYAMFGDWNLALAGYNAGEGNVQRAIKRAKTNDFWALAKTRSFRSETKNYVPLIHAAIVIAKSPEFYGIDLSPEELTAVETIRVSGSYPITTVARCANTQPEEIKRLNPELRRGLTPSSAFDLEVPHGSGERVTTCLAGERAMDYARHVVRKRDTLSLIARMFGVSSSEIARVNGLSLKANLKPGAELAIPRPTRTAAARTPANGRTDTTGPDTSYKIRKGDTLSSVAARHSTTIEAIKALNGLSSSRLSIGQVLRVASVSTDSSLE